MPRHTLAYSALAAATVALALFAVDAAATRSIPDGSRPVAVDTAVFAGGCFWGIEGVYEHVKGVTNVVSGFTGGSTAKPTYDQVSSSRTGHAEAVRVIFDPAEVSYRQLLEIFFLVAHDPTELNRQGPDVGPQYRSALYHNGAVQKEAADAYVAELRRTKLFGDPIVTEIAPLGPFHLAEAYHQDYMARHPNEPYIVANDAPKVRQLRRMYPALFREPPKA